MDYTNDPRLDELKNLANERNLLGPFLSSDKNHDGSWTSSIRIIKGNSALDYQELFLESDKYSNPNEGYDELFDQALNYINSNPEFFSLQKPLNDNICS